jgi:hypothetical protein
VAFRAGRLGLSLAYKRDNYFSYIETAYLSEHKVDASREDLYRQDTPEKGLYLLYDSFLNMKGLITDISRAGHISFMGFMNVGNLVSKEIRENIFFNPFRKKKRWLTEIRCSEKRRLSWLSNQRE